MKNIEHVFALLLIGLMAGCASVSVNTDYDSSADFTGLKTYSWDTHGPSKTGDSRIDGNTLLQGRITNAVDSTLALKGFRKFSSGTPDFLVNYHVSSKDKTDVESFGPSYYGGSYYGGGYRGGYAGAHSMYGGGVTTFHYTEGTLLIDIIDPTTKHLMWRGTGTKVVDPDASSDKKIQVVNDAVAKILTNFSPIIFVK